MKPKYIYAVVNVYSHDDDVDSYWYDSESANNRADELRKKVPNAGFARYNTESGANDIIITRPAWKVEVDVIEVKDGDTASV